MARSRTASAVARVDQALAAAYRAFAAPAPAAIKGCPCCVAKRGVDVLLTTPLRELTGKQLWGYVSGVFLTVGDERDFRYLLPRVLHVSAVDPANANDPEIVLGKLRLANWRSWSASEQGPIEEFVDAWFELALAQDLAEADEGWIGTRSESVLCGAARAGLPLAHLLLRLRDPWAGPVLADLEERFPDQLSPFWEDAPEGFQELATILSQRQT